jgi:hypothetical protein
MVAEELLISAEFVALAGGYRRRKGDRTGRWQAARQKLPDNAGFANRCALKPHYSAPSSENESRLNDWLSPSWTVGPQSAPIHRKIDLRLKLSFAQMT